MFTRDLSTDNTINIVFGISAFMIGLLALFIAWKTWRSTRRRPGVNTNEGRFPVSSMSYQLIFGCIDHNVRSGNEDIERQRLMLLDGYEMTVSIGRPR